MDDDLQQSKAVLPYPEQPQSVFVFCEQVRGLQNIDLNSPNEVVCAIFFHFRFLKNIEARADRVVSACCVALRREFPVVARVAQIYYGAQNDLVYVKQKDLSQLLMDLLLAQLEDQNAKRTQYLQVLIHEVLAFLPPEFALARAPQPEPVRARPDAFYAGKSFGFLEARLRPSPVRYQIRGQSELTQISFVCTLLSKILLRHPRPLMQLINAQVLGQMTLSDTYTLNPASREFVSLSQRAAAAGAGESGVGNKSQAEADVTLPVLETQQDLRPMDRVQLLFMMLLAEQFTYSFEYVREASVDVIQVCQFFFYYAMQLDALKCDNGRAQPLVFSYLEKRKSMVVMYLNIISQMYLLVSLDT